jgi:hypothetical protein
MYFLEGDTFNYGKEQETEEPTVDLCGIYSILDSFQIRAHTVFKAGL